MDMNDTLSALRNLLEKELIICEYKGKVLTKKDALLLTDDQLLEAIINKNLSNPKVRQDDLAEKASWN